MNMIEDIENLIPHRERLKLIDSIVSVDQEHAVTRATVKENWPLLSVSLLIRSMPLPEPR
jgi:predicted hotdog family 3-hydroxylacyl-ACP dehydratase